MMKNNARQYISPRERGVIARLAYEKTAIITQEQFDKYFKFPRSVRSKIFFRLRKKGIFTAIKKGVYFYSPLEAGPAGSSINEFLVPQVFFPKGNYYVGYSTMYSYYGFTNQIFQTMYILNSSLQKEKIIGSVRFRMLKIPIKRMFGLENIKIRDTELIVSDRERTLVDLIYFPEPVGGLKRALEILKDQVRGKKTNINRLLRYAVKFPGILTKKRIGFTLERAGVKDGILKPLLGQLRKTSLVTLYPSKSRKGKINRRWMIIENAA